MGLRATGEVQDLQRRFGTLPGASLPAFVEDSWLRCLDSHHILPDCRRRPTILTQSELHMAVDREEDLIRAALPEIDRLFHHLVQDDYLVSLAAPDGVKLVFRCAPTMLEDLGAAGVTPGSIWTEETEGTNGIGTGLKLGRALSIVGGQHFHVALKALTCTVAPIRGAEGRVEGMVNISSHQIETPRTASLLRGLAERSAQRIEAQLFRRRHRGQRLVTLSRQADFADPATMAMLALDDLGRVVAATSTAAMLLGQAHRPLAGRWIDQILAPGSLLRADDLPPGAVTDGAGGIFARWEVPGQARPPTARPPAPPRMIAAPSPDPRHSQIMARARRLIDAGQPLVICGESGVGKTHFARALSGAVQQDARRVVLLNGAADPGQNIATLQGLTGAQDFTLILDQVEELPGPVQQALLALLEDDAALALQGIALMTVAAQPLLQLVAAGKLRADLAHRLAGTTLELPPLRSAPALGQIIAAVFHREADALSRDDLALAPDALNLLVNHHWPGNLRQLTKALRHAVALAETQVTACDLPDDLLAQSHGHDLRARSQQESARIEAALRHNRGNVAETARYLGISRATLYRKIKVPRPPKG